MTAPRSTDSSRKENSDNSVLSKNSLRHHRIKKKGILEKHEFPREIMAMVLLPHTPLQNELETSKGKEST